MRINGHISYVLLLLVSSATSQPSGEPACYSRFDYDHKVMTSLVALEAEQAKLRELVKELQIELSETKRAHAEELRSHSNKLSRIDAVASVGGGGTTYIRHGRSVCPENGTEFVYDGYVAGAHYTEPGGAVDYLCLPKDPVWGQYKDGNQGGSSVYGAEYEFSTREDFFARNIFEHDVPCAVCRTKRSSAMMVPARNTCHDGWTLEYHGYLMGGHSSHKASSKFVCLDVQPESLDGGYTSSDGKLFYFAEVYCGALRCPPYVQGRELTCAVCSK